MRRLSLSVVAAALVAGGFPATIAPAAAQTVASPADAAAAGQFVDELADRVFAVLKETSSKSAIKTKFRGMLRDNFAVDAAGARLIRRYRSQITPAQLASYQAVLPDYVVNIYADRLINYSNADVRIVRTAPRGTRGDVDVYSRIQSPGQQPFDVIWAITKGAGGRWLIQNVTVAGVNLSLTQEADFSSFIAKNGFDALVTMMKSANARSA